MRFYLGTHHPHWLGFSQVPLFVSHRRLDRYKRLPKAVSKWALDSGGFSEISLYGRWVTTARDYAAKASRYQREVGRMEWAAIQDWMCEPWMLEKTGLSVYQHQARSVNSYLELTDLAPEVPWIPVLQGWAADDYQQHWDQYAHAGVDLERLPVVGLGSVCRRQNTSEFGDIVRSLQPLKLHGFGVKTTGLLAVGHLLTSADSLAWSSAARRGERLAGCSGHKNCANCPRYAMLWRERLLEKLYRPLRLEARRLLEGSARQLGLDYEERIAA